MKTKIIKITSISCILCLSKLSKTLNSISEIHTYKVNLLTKEIYIEYKRNLNKILLILKEKGFKFDKDDAIKRNFIMLILIVCRKMVKHNVLANICFMFYIQFTFLFYSKISYYIFLSYINIIMYVIQMKQKYIDNAFDILLFTCFNELLSKFILKMSKLDTFFVYENFKFRKIFENLNIIHRSNNKNKILKRIKRYRDNNQNDENVFWKYENAISKGDLIYIKQNEKVNFNFK